MSDFRLPPRCKLGLRFSGMLHSVDVSGLLSVPSLMVEQSGLPDTNIKRRRVKIEAVRL